jgi:WD40 repeat protein
MPKMSRTLLPVAARFIFFGTAFGLVGGLGLLPPEKQQEQASGIPLGQHQYCVRCLAFAPDGKMLATGGGFSDSPNEIKLWDVLTGTERATFRGNQTGIQAMAFAADGRTLATVSSERIVTLWDVATGRQRAGFPVLVPRPLQPAPVADGQTLAVAGSQGDPGSVRLWRIAAEPEPLMDAAPGPAVFSVDGRRLTVWRLAPEPGHIVADVADGADLAPLGTFDELPGVGIRDIPLGLETLTLHADPTYVWALALSPDGQTLATGGFDDTVKLWDVASGRQTATLWGHTDQVGAVAYAPDGKVLASGSHDTTVRLWSAATGEELVTLRGHTGTVTCVAFDPTGQWIASGSHDRTVRLWPVATAR